jgi:D-serine deaminase-like pyridoxal phosphate-dependent protein
LKKLNAEHGIIHLDNPSVSLDVGDKIELQVHDSDATINLHHLLYGIRNGAVEEFLRLKE